jgi:diketogulonate reductase-like aldo/keto reductase
MGLVEAVGVCNYKTSQLQQFHSLMLARDIPIASNQVPMLSFYYIAGTFVNVNI